MKVKLFLQQKLNKILHFNGTSREVDRVDVLYLEHQYSKFVSGTQHNLIFIWQCCSLSNVLEVQENLVEWHWTIIPEVNMPVIVVKETNVRLI
jgi:hypothetical protein